jgi:hypothetical protein
MVSSHMWRTHTFWNLKLCPNIFKNIKDIKKENPFFFFFLILEIIYSGVVHLCLQNKKKIQKKSLKSKGN